MTQNHETKNHKYQHDRFKGLISDFLTSFIVISGLFSLFSSRLSFFSSGFFVVCTASTFSFTLEALELFAET